MVRPRKSPEGCARQLALAGVEPALQQQDHGAAGGVEGLPEIRAGGGLSRLPPLGHHMAGHNAEGTLGRPDAGYPTVARMSQT